MAATHHILLLGGTGLCGQIFLQAALEAGHKLTLYCRTPSKLSSEIASHPNVTVIEGKLDDVEGLKKAAGCGADVFISLAGPTLGKREGTPITNCLRQLYPLLLKANPKIRILLLSTASYSAPQDKRSIKWFFAINGYVRVIGGDAYTEISGITKETVALGEGVDWTVFRVPLLKGSQWDKRVTNGKGDSIEQVHGEENTAETDGRDEVDAAWVGDEKGRDGLFLDRSRLARWILKELEERKWVRLCPILANA